MRLTDGEPGPERERRAGLLTRQCRAGPLIAATRRATCSAAVARRRRNKSRLLRSNFKRFGSAATAGPFSATAAAARHWCGSKGACNRPRYPCHYCTYRGGLLRQGAVDKAKTEGQRHAG